MPGRTIGAALLLGLLALAAPARADGTRLRVGLGVADEERRAAVHEALMVALAKAGFDPADDPAVEPGSSEDELRALSQQTGEPVLAVRVGAADAGRVKVTATCAAGAVVARDAKTVREAQAAAEAGRLGSKVAEQVASPRGGLLSSGLGHTGLIVGIAGLGVFALAYIPGLVVASQYGDVVPNAARSGRIPVFGPFLARAKLSDEILNKGASPGLIADGLLQVGGAAALLTGVGLIVYAKVAESRAAAAEAGPAPAKAGGEPVSLAPTLFITPQAAGAGVALSW